jgi:hypothetical protein
MKNKLFKYATVFVLSITAGVFTACETTDLDINENPSSLTLESANPNYILNSIQFSFASQNLSLNGISSGVMRHTNLFGTYAGASAAGTLNGAWSNTYSITNNLNLIETLAETQNLSKQVGIGLVLEAWAYVNLVDYIGTAVYSEAVNPEFEMPNLDSGESIYDAMYAQLDLAITKLNGTSDSDPEDLYYNGDMSKWVKAANTLKLKMYIQSKLVNTDATAAINAIVSSGNFIKDAADDFVIQFGTKETNPDNRHPWFSAAYVGGAGGTYMSNDFIYKLKEEKGFEDPRLKHYMYRQSLTDPSGDKLPCAGNADYDYCYLGDSYWGRGHGDDEGIPNDNNQRTTYGAYPAGGAFDDGESNTTTGESVNLGGEGIYPIWLSHFTHFMLAESALPAPAGLGTTGTPLTYLTTGMQQSFDKVAGFTGGDMDATAVTNYISFVTDEYNNAASDADKLAVVMREYYIAMWGNSIEAYNNYRRTGFPTLQESVISGTDFPRSYFLPSSELNSNDNPDLVQKKLTDQVFWDTNPAGFIN